MPAEIHETALRMLARRALSRHEVSQRLERKGFGAAAIRAEVARLERSGLLDDDRLACAVASSSLRHGRGRRAVAATLRRRGLGRGSTESAIAAIGEEEESGALLQALAKAARRYPELGRLPDARRKVIRYLVARGFRVAAIVGALESHCGEGADAGEGEVVEPEGP